MADFDAQAHASLLAAAMDLSIPPDIRSQIVIDLAAFEAAARLLHAFPLDDQIEPAPVFEA